MFLFGFTRRTMSHATGCVSRAMGNCACGPRKRFTICLVFLSLLVLSLFVFSLSNVQLPCENKMEQQLTEIRANLDFLESQYRTRQEDVITLQAKLLGREDVRGITSADDVSTSTMSPEVVALLKNMTGSRAAAGVSPKNLQPLRVPFVYQLLPHLMNDPLSLRPAYHMKAGNTFADIVLGIPTVKRDKESYLLVTLSHLVDGLTDDYMNSTLIVVMVGETDMEYILNTARQIESMFSKQVDSGLIEVIAPAASYYPDFESLPNTLGDSAKRVRWRTKQNLDTIYLMAYAQSKGTFYLMLEDDVIAKKSYMQDIKQFTADTTIRTPDWFFIEYCHVGGIGKLFRSTDLAKFIVYVQLFYNNMPIDWLLESYLADRVCTIDKTSKACGQSKLQIRPKFKTSLFQHIGLYSSLKGKIQKIKDAQYGAVPTFYPHSNLPIANVRTTIEEHTDHTLRRAYDGQTYFWGVKPKKGDLIEFWFNKPIILERYTFRSGNVEHVSDKLYDCAVEVLPVYSNFTQVGVFDEFGLADGELKKDIGPITAIRLKITRDCNYWVILSEIDLRSQPIDSR
ncbi:alpha-1,3-mannosyl-glycoprotein 4-beta-N-acetylglucosaminyltransferase A-like isoform X2 [Galleria mellonella]|uniref:Alpha-1,3-mannosyl-glycoprotein 4-beta-N-acetylglucosaminyltransferase A-like isoform X2 n=1 Tax=Galleria mellonella TaxID=7137 RepID=A0A6J1X064_GALME|nr:alpha-1,3-mannosyl-glycoprotein 4-beta-N-acetylglucosaminyltransferase A-like isoform X2 [Galleria mellonella]